MTEPKFHIISGFSIPVITVEPRTDVRFLSQRQLRALETDEARAREFAGRAKFRLAA